MTTRSTSADARFNALVRLLASDSADRISAAGLEGNDLHLARKQLGVDLPPFLRTLLVADGTVTMALEAFYDEPVDVVTMNQSSEALATSLPALVIEQGEEVLYREVILRGRQSDCVYASAYSLIRKAAVGQSLYQALVEERVGIGTLLRNTAKGSYREILKLRLGGLGDDLEIGAGELMVNRTYCVYLDSAPGILITEVFPVSRYMSGR